MIRLSVSAMALCAGLSPAFALTTTEAADRLEACFGAPCEVTFADRTESEDGTILLSGVTFTADGEDAPTLDVGEVLLIEMDEGGVLAQPQGDIKIVTADGKVAEVEHEDLTAVIDEATGSDILAVVATTLTLTGADEDDTQKRAVLVEPVFTIATDESLGTTVGMTAETLTIEAKTTSEEGGSGTLVFNKPEFSTEASAELLSAMADEETPTEGSGIFSAGYSGMTATIESPAGPVTLGSGPLSTNATFEEGVAKYAFSVRDVSTSAQVPDLGPIEVKMGRMEMLIEGPVSDEGGEFSAAYEIDGLSADETSWSLVDPDGKLPHESGSLAVHVSGKAVKGEDGELTLSEVTMDKLDLALLGARVEASGNAAFSAGAPSSGEGFITLSGAQTLMTSLADAGLLPASAGMQARAMLGMFAVPKPGADDVLTSEIRMSEDGALTVNGAKME